MRSPPACKKRQGKRQLINPGKRDRIGQARNTAGSWLHRHEREDHEDLADVMGMGTRDEQQKPMELLENCEPRFKFREQPVTTLSLRASRGKWLA